MSNEAPRSKLRGIKAKFTEANPPSLRRASARRLAILSGRILPACGLAKTDHPCIKLQNILVKANKRFLAEFIPQGGARNDSLGLKEGCDTVD